MLEKFFRRCKFFINIYLEKIFRFINYYISLFIFYLFLPFLLLLKNKKNTSYSKGNLLIIRNRYANKKKNLISNDFFFIDDVPGVKKNINNLITQTFDNKITILNLALIGLNVILKDISFIVIAGVSYKANYGLKIFSFEILSKTLNIPISSIWWDTCSYSTMKFLNEYQLSLNKKFSLLQTFATDNPFYYPLNKVSPKDYFATNNVIGIFSIVNPNRFYPSKIKDIDILCIGQVGSYRSSRIKYFDEIKKLESNYKVVISPLDREEFMPWEDYISLCSRSKIIVNFSESVDFHQLKGRVFEAMTCGAVIMDNVESPIFLYFEEGKHFMSYKDEIDLPLQIKLLLSDHEKCRNISANAEAFLRNNFSCESWWSILLRNS